MLFQQLSSFDFFKIYCKETVQHAIATMCQFVHNHMLFYTVKKFSVIFFNK